MAIASRPTAELILSLAIMTFAALIVLLSVVATIALIPGTLLVLAMAFSTDSAALMGPGNRVVGWITIVWFPIALLVALHNAVGLETMNQPSPGAAARLLGLSILIVLLFPPFWQLWP